MEPTRYTLSARNPSAHLFEVACTIDDPARDGQRFVLPSWIPGSYLIREFARHIVSARAHDAKGPVRLSKVAKDTWEAGPASGPLTVTIDVYAHDVSVRTSYLDATRGYFNGPSVFLLPEGRAQAPCVVDIVAPTHAGGERWRVATTLRRDGAAPWGFGRYGAANYDELIDHPVEMADFQHLSFLAGGVTHDVVVSGRARFDGERLARDLAKICQWQCDLFGGAPGSRAPFDRYLFQVTAVGEGYGGLEHRSSTSLLCSRRDLPASGVAKATDDYRGFLGLASHEYFHSWNVKRIKPAAFVPYDLAREAYTRQLWAFEGITSYYDDLALVRSGVIDVDGYLELLGRTMSSVLRTPGRAVQSVADASFDAWIKYYRPDENTPNACVSYYAKGALVALALDLTLRDHGSSLDALMRELWREHGASGIGVPEDGLRKLAERLAGRDLAAFFAAFVEGTDELPLASLLRMHGVALGLRPAQGVKDKGGKKANGDAPRVSIGATVGADMRLTHVFAGAAAEHAGLSAGDTLVALDGLKATGDRIDAYARDARPGDRIAVHAFRRDELIEATLELAAAPEDTAWLALDADASPDAIARRERWLA
ncbi:MAG TPA: peptidase M61 [Casimicrobiaceae bacterium]